MEPVTEKKDLPSEIETALREWGMGLRCLPSEYVKFHAERAEEELKAVAAKFNLTVHCQKFVSDGWGDRMETLEAIVETPSRKLLKLQYCDTNQGFLMQCPSGGFGWITDKELL